MTPEGRELTEEELITHKALKYREFLRERCKKLIHL